MAFPGSTPSYAGFTASHTLAADSHAAQSNAEQADIIALANKLGTGASTPTSGLVLRGNGTGTSAWGQVILTTDVSGVLPQANGGTGTTLATGTGKAVYDTSPTIATPTVSGGTFSSPTITTPTIASFINATHNHQNAAGGGQIAAAAITSLDLTNTTLLNPYKFSVNRTAAFNAAAGGFKIVAFDVELFDTNNNYLTDTYTVPVNGFYQFNAGCQVTETSAANTVITSIFVNGVEKVRGSRAINTGTSDILGSTVSGLLQLTAGDTVKIEVYSGTTSAFDVGLPAYNTFSGFLVSTT